MSRRARAETPTEEVTTEPTEAVATETVAVTETPVVQEAEGLTPVSTNEMRVYNLNAELIRLEQQKKSAASLFRDDIKRIKNEIKDIYKAAGTNLEED